MRFVSTPLQFVDSGTKIVRDIEDRILMLDNLVELIVFTPRGDFEADPDFGFEYWNHEFSNIHYMDYHAFLFWSIIKSDTAGLQQLNKA